MAKEKKTYHWFPIIKNRSACPVCNTEFVTSKLVLTLYDGLNVNSINATHKVKFCNSCHVPFLTSTEIKAIEQEHPGYHLETGNMTNTMSRTYLEKQIVKRPLPIKNIPKNRLLFIGEEHHHACSTSHLTKYQGLIHGDQQVPVKLAECSVCKRQIISPIEYKRIHKKCPDYIYVTDAIKWGDIFPNQKTIYLLNINQYTKDRCPSCNGPLQNTGFYFKNNKNSTLQHKNVKQCSKCRNIFVRNTSFKDCYDTYKFSNEFYQEEPFRKDGKHIVIKTGDFLTRHNLQNCIANNHSIEDITARIHMVDKSGNEFDYDIPAIRCDTCGKLFILEKNMKEYRNKGFLFVQLSKTNIGNPKTTETKTGKHQMSKVLSCMYMVITYLW